MHQSVPLILWVHFFHSITLDIEGKFLRATVVPQEDCDTIIPCTEKSISSLLVGASKERYSSAKVHRSLSVAPKPDISDPRKIEDYTISLTELDGLEPQVIKGTYDPEGTLMV